jgi:hypothetical protein
VHGTTVAPEQALLLCAGRLLDLQRLFEVMRVRSEPGKGVEEARLEGTAALRSSGSNLAGAPEVGEGIRDGLPPSSAYGREAAGRRRGGTAGPDDVTHEGVSVAY